MTLWNNEHDDKYIGTHVLRTRATDAPTLEKIAVVAKECHAMVNAKVTLLKVVESSKERGEYQAILERSRKEGLALDVEK